MIANRRKALSALSVVGILVGLVSTQSALAGAGREATVAPPSRLAQYQLKPDLNGNLYFYGSSVAISGDIMAVGATGQAGTTGANQGAVFLFTKPAAASWFHARDLGELTASDGAPEDSFGARIAMTANTIVVTAPEKTVGQGGSAHHEQGAAYVFTEPATGWTSATQTAELTTADGAANDLLNAVAVSRNTIVLGVRNHTVSAHADQGEAYIFTKPAAGWKSTSSSLVLNDPNQSAKDNFGSAVAASGDTVYVGASGASFTGSDDVGLAYAYTDATQAWTSVPSPGALIASNRTSGEQFGSDLAVSGSTVVVSAASRNIGSNYAQGAVYVFTEPTAGWALVQDEQAYLLQSDGQTQDEFGDPVAISGNTIVAGAHQHTIGAATAEGAAYAFTKPIGGWANASEKANLLASNGASDSVFGDAVAVSDDAILIGADSHKQTTYSGTAYVFALPLPTLTMVRQTRKSWRAGKRAVLVNPRHRHSGGTVFSGVLNDPATLRLHFYRDVGAKNGRSRGTIKVAATKAGPVTVYFDGVVSKGQVLSPGHYFVNIDAASSAGVARTTRLRFTVLAPKKPKRKH